MGDLLFRSPRHGAHLWRPVSALVALALVAAACSSGAGGGASGPSPKIRVTIVRGTSGRKVVSVAPGTTLTEALAAAKVKPIEGMVRSIGKHKAIRPNGRHFQLRSRGAAIDGATPLHGPVVVEVIDGSDTTEKTKARTVPIPPSGLPKALQYVQVVGKTGSAQETVGAESGEVVGLKVIDAGTSAHRATGMVVALTFDDGPDGRYTPEVLRILKHNHIHATFCEIGREAARNAEYSKAVIAGGNQLCNHTQNHVEGLERQPLEAVQNEIGGGRESVLKASGAEPSYYRPPGGSLGPAIYQVAASIHEPVLYWSIDPRDWDKPPPEEIVSAVASHLRPGAIILLHDGGGDRSATLTALPQIISLARGLGYTFTLPITNDPAAG